MSFTGDVWERLSSRDAPLIPVHLIAAGMPPPPEVNFIREPSSGLTRCVLVGADATNRDAFFLFGSWDALQLD